MRFIEKIKANREHKAYCELVVAKEKNRYEYMVRINSECGDQSEAYRVARERWATINSEMHQLGLCPDMA